MANRHTIDFPIFLDRTSAVPIYEQLALALRTAITDGKLHSDSGLPSTRTLCDKLGVARATILRSFRLLIEEGLIETIPGKKVDVVDNFAPVANPDDCFAGGQEGHAKAMAGLSSQAMYSLVCQRDLAESAFNRARTFSPKRLPVDDWDAIMRRQLRLGVLDWHEDRQDALGHERLRRALARHLARCVSVHCQSDQIVIFANRARAINFISSMLIDRGDLVAVENPGHVEAAHTFSAYGAELMPISVDEHGLRVKELIDLAAPVKLLHTTCGHNFPTGGLMPLAERHELLSWARQSGALIIENDIELQHTPESHRLSTLQALDGGRQVIYMSSFSNVLHRLVELSFAVFPRHCIPAVSALAGMSNGSLSDLEQRALAEFIDGGYLERWSRKNARNAASRRQALVYALIKNFHSAVKVLGRASEAILAVQFRMAVSDDQIAAAANKANFFMYSSRPNYHGQRDMAEYCIPFQDLSEEEISQAVERLAHELSCPDMAHYSAPAPGPVTPAR